MPPPSQCPSCGRFLKRALVESLAQAPAPCPGCGTELVAGMFDGGSGRAPTSEPSAPVSVRPPDLEPGSVRDESSDVLAGWDEGGEVVDLDRWRADRPPFPVDAAVVGGSAVVGATVGAVTDRRRARGAVLGALVGAVLGAVVRRIWRLED